MKPKKLVVTGATGFVGRHLLNRLLADADSRVIVIGRHPPNGLRDGDSFVHSDLADLDPQQLRDVCAGDVDTVFHLAASTPKNREQANLGNDLIRNNVTATWKLLEALPSVVNRFVFASTLDVYGSQSCGEPLDEGSTIAPSTVYGATKVCAEHLVRVGTGHRAVPWTILRLGHIYGPGEEAYEKLIPSAVRRLLDGHAPIMYGGENVLRDYLFVADAVEALVRAGIVPAAVGQIINIVSGRSITLRETLELLIQVSGEPVKIEVLTKQHSATSFRFRNDRMREVLGNWSLVSLRDGLKSEFDHARENAARATSESL